MPDELDQRLAHLLRAARAPCRAADLAAALGVSQPTLSRAVARAGDRIVRVGRARATRYLPTRDIALAGDRWPLYRIDGAGRAARVGDLRALYNGGFALEADGPCPALRHGDFADGIYPGLPWFLDDQRPQGYLGRALARRIAGDLGANEDIRHWSTDDVVRAWLLHGADHVGDLVLGERHLRRALAALADPPDVVPSRARARRYPGLALAALRGELPGSSVAGEQPKFSATVRERGGDRAVLVKFSEGSRSSAAQRWADLLECEHLAGSALLAGGIAAAQSALLRGGGRTFLESTRFDRTPTGGRRGFVSLAALDGAYYGHGRIEWWRFANELERDGWIGADDARHLRIRGWFGELIANTDMHLGNAGLVLTDERPLALAPSYDMLPMRFAPAANGELVDRELPPMPPHPEARADWAVAAELAVDFWTRVSIARSISRGFRAIASRSRAAIERAQARFA